MKIVFGQLLRFGIVGVITNGSGYFVYLILTMLGLGHKTTMTLLYGVSIVLAFFFNKRWTFRSENNTHSALKRYFATYMIGYIINFIVLFIFVDKLGIAHQIVMAILIIVMAIYFFTLQKYWVFSKLEDLKKMESIRQ